MCEAIKDLLDLLTPATKDIKEKNNELETLKQKVVELEDIIQYVENDILKVIDFKDQEIIKKYFSDEDKYKIALYLLKAENTKVFPQYKEVYNYIDETYKNIKTTFPLIRDEYESLEKECEYKKLCLKYVEILKDKKYYISDNDEFLNLLKKINISNEDKIKILNNTIKNNINYYNHQVNNEKEFKDLDILKIQKVLNDNKKYLQDKYQESMNKVSNYADLENTLNNLINKDILYRFSVKDIINAKKAYLTLQLTENYKRGSFNKVNENIKDIEKVNYIENKIKDITDVEEIIRRIKEA